MRNCPLRMAFWMSVRPSTMSATKVFSTKSLMRAISFSTFHHPLYIFWGRASMTKHSWALVGPTLQFVPMPPVLLSDQFLTLCTRTTATSPLCHIVSRCWWCNVSSQYYIPEKYKCNVTATVRHTPRLVEEVAGCNQHGEIRSDLLYPQDHFQMPLQLPRMETHRLAKVGEISMHSAEPPSVLQRPCYRNSRKICRVLMLSCCSPTWLCALNLPFNYSFFDQFWLMWCHPFRLTTKV